MRVKSSLKVSYSSYAKRNLVKDMLKWEEFAQNMSGDAILAVSLLDPVPWTFLKAKCTTLCTRNLDNFYIKHFKLWNRVF